jgi:environmental stress-induced protein Ves
MDMINLCKESVYVNILRANQQQTSNWSGGTTTQLAIYPENTEYKDRNFEWRVSTARIDLEESTFTSLPGVHRLLMILEGQIGLTHEGIRSRSLKPFEQDEFDGGWITKSFGKCIDFNLMLVGCSGKLDTVNSHNLNLFEQEINSVAWEAFYCLSTTISVTINIQDEVFTSKLGKGDFLLIKARKGAHSFKFSHDSSEGLPVAVRATVYK